MLSTADRKQRLTLALAHRMDTSSANFDMGGPMPDYPDIYADGVSISASAYGLTLTFTLSEPTGAPGTEASPTRPVGRIRMGAALAAFVAETLRAALANQPLIGTAQSTSPKSIS